MLQPRTLFIAAMLLWASTVVFSQEEKLINIDADGDFHIGTTTVVGANILKRGMYRVRLIRMNGKDIAIFESVAMGHAGRGMWLKSRKELFRLELAGVNDGKAKRTSLRTVRYRKHQLATVLTFKGLPHRFLLPQPSPEL